MSIKITAFAPHNSYRRRFYFFFLVLAIVHFLYWCHFSYFTDDQTEWDIVDFRITPYASEGNVLERIQALSDDDDIGRDSISNAGRYAMFQQQQSLHDGVQSKIQDFIQWERPSTDHWPTWSDYEHTDYDPNRWEAMDRYVESSQSLRAPTDTTTATMISSSTIPSPSLKIEASNLSHIFHILGTIQKSGKGGGMASMFLVKVLSKNNTKRARQIYKSSKDTDCLLTCYRRQLWVLQNCSAWT